VKAEQVPVTERTLVWRSYECFNRRAPEAVKPLYTRDCRWSFRHFFGWPENQEYRGHDGLVRLFDDFLSAWGEFEIVPLALWNLGHDRWFIHCQMTATGVSSGVPLQIEFWQSGTVVGGRIDSVEQYTDRDEALAAAGLEPGDL
jgi:ketosteroid isomerase-like protein